MAMQWIKMRVDLQTNPKVVRIMSALNADKFRVIGGLHAVWSVFDAHSEDGRLDGYSFDLMDSIVGWPGLSNAMASTGWLRQDGQVLVAPDFIEHNGRTAKRRAMETQRKSEARKTSASDADKKRTREEKRREEVNQQKQDESKFEVFWSLYPRKQGKGAAEKAFLKAKLNGYFDVVVAALERQKQSEQWQKDGGQFIPNPATWLNQRRWEDEIPSGDIKTFTPVNLL